MSVEKKEEVAFAGFNGKWEEVGVKDDTLSLKYKSDKNEFMDNLPISKDDYVAAKKYEETYSKAGIVFAKDKAVEELEKNKNLKAVEISMPWGHLGTNKLEVDVKREVTAVIPKTGEKISNSRISVNIHETRMSDDWLKELRNEITDKLLK